MYKKHTMYIYTTYVWAYSNKNRGKFRKEINMTNGTSLFFSAHHDCRHKFKNWNIRHDIFDHVVCCHLPPRWFNLCTIKPILEKDFLWLLTASLPAFCLLPELIKNSEIKKLLSTPSIGFCCLFYLWDHS